MREKKEREMYSSVRVADVCFHLIRLIRSFPFSSNLPNGNDVNEFSLIFNFERYLAREKIENGILSIVLHSILIECTDVNCVGPPSGNELKLFRAKEMVLR